MHDKTSGIRAGLSLLAVLLTASGCSIITI